MRTPEKAQQPGETPTPPLPALEIAAAGQKYHQVHQFVYLGGLITEDADITRDINRRTKIAWGCFRKFSTELFDRPNAPLRLKARLLKAEAMEALLYGCMTWAPRNAYYRQLRTPPHILKHSFLYLIVHLLFEEISRAYLIPLLSRQIQFDGGSTTCFSLQDHDRHLSSNFNHTSFNRGNFSFLTDVVEEKEDHSAQCS